MKGPIRAAAPFRYAPVDIDVKTLRKGKGKLKDGIFTKQDRDWETLTYLNCQNLHCHKVV